MITGQCAVMRDGAQLYAQIQNQNANKIDHGRVFARQFCLSSASQIKLHEFKCSKIEGRESLLLRYYFEKQNPAGTETQTKMTMSTIEIGSQLINYLFKSNRFIAGFSLVPATLPLYGP